MKPGHLKILRSLLSEPTAPFHEQGVARQVWRWARRRGVAFGRDAGGNVLLEYRRGRGGGVPWVFSAHMDHPGFVARRRRGRVLWADFIGSVRREYFPGSRVRFFPPGGEVPAVIAGTRKIKDTPWFACRLALAAPAAVPAGTIGTWDLPAMRLRGNRLASRACDDAVGSAAVVCAIDEIVSRRLDARVLGLLTRAEEAAFIGAMAACESGSIPRGARVIALETSSARPGAALGDGVVVRVGDKMRTFDPSLTAHVWAVAQALTRRDRSFRCIRRLMSGGTCESTAYAAWGHTAAALCIPLGNYHNQGRGGAIAAERIHLDDFASLVKLLVALAADRRGPADTDRALRRHLRKILRARGGYLNWTAT